MKAFVKKIVAAVHARATPRWPFPSYNEKPQPHFLFIITPPNSGSTAIAKLLDSSPRTMTLTNEGEGQWLVPGLCENDRWNPNKEVDYASVKAVWLNAFQQTKLLDPHVDVVIEKSPPNMMRIEKLSSQFEHCSFLANNRDPYAYCASILYRYYDTDSIDSTQRKALLEQVAQKWLTRSHKIWELIMENDIPLLTYEDFCHDPSSVLDVLSLPEDVADTIDTKARVEVKDYGVQPISNQNHRQISKLTDEEIEHIGSILLPYTGLMGFFGYQLMQ